MSYMPHQKKKIKEQLIYLKNIVKNVIEDPNSIERYPQTIDNWMKVLSKELEALTYMLNSR